MGRRYELDLTRICACLMVVLLHTAATGWRIDPWLPEWRYYNLADMMVRAGVPLFFMISGALFLSKRDFAIGKFLRRHVAFLLLLFVVWSSFYRWNSWRLQPADTDMHDFVLGVIGGHYHLQFLIFQCILYLLLPILHACIHGKKMDVRYLLALFGLVLIKENLSLLPNLPDILAALLGKVDYTLVVYAGYMVLGYWLSGRTYPRGTRAVCLAVYTAVTLLGAWCNRWYSIQQGAPKEWLYGYLCVTTLIQAVCIFSFFQTLRGAEIKYPRALLELSANTLGIYLLHPFVLEALKRRGISVALSVPLKSIPFIFVLVVAICLAMTAVLRRIPLVRKLIAS